MITAAVKVFVTLPIRDSSVGSHAVVVVRFDRPVAPTQS
jgi:hypothetical protein